MGNQSVASSGTLVNGSDISHWLKPANIVATTSGFAIIMIGFLFYNDEGDTWANNALSCLINVSNEIGASTIAYGVL